MRRWRDVSTRLNNCQCTPADLFHHPLLGQKKQKLTKGKAKDVCIRQDLPVQLFVEICRVNVVKLFCRCAV